MCMTNSPCFDTESRTDCPRRYVGCKASCEKWHEWLAVHAEEKQRIEAKRREGREALDHAYHRVEVFTRYNKKGKKVGQI